MPQQQAINTKGMTFKLNYEGISFSSFKTSLHYQYKTNQKHLEK
jgi:hypothetical protein